MMINPDLNVHPAFNDAIVFRTTYPLFKGKYKIEQFHFDAQRFLDTLDSIINFKTSGRRESWDESLGCCVATIEDQNIWLQSLPENLAYLFGYHLVTGINALHGDGLSQDEVLTLNRRYRMEIDRIISELVAAEVQFKRTDKRKLNHSQVKELRALVLRAIDIVNSVLRDVGPVKVH